jgi:hypothetical protein
MNGSASIRYLARIVQHLLFKVMVVGSGLLTVAIFAIALFVPAMDRRRSWDWVQIAGYATLIGIATLAVVIVWASLA